MPATSEPASGSVIPRHEIFSPRMAGARDSCFCSSVPNAGIGGVAMSVWTASPIASPPQCACTSSSARTRLHGWSPPWPPYPPGIESPSNPNSPVRGKTQASKVLELPLVGVGLELLDDERVDRLAQPLVVLGEDEVPAPCVVVGLEDGVGAGHGVTLTVVGSLNGCIEGVAEPVRACSAAGVALNWCDPGVRCDAIAVTLWE